MDNSKKIKLGEILFWLFLAIFPLGQLVRIETHILGNNVTVQPVDVIALIFLTLLATGGFIFPKISKYLTMFLGAALFSQVIFIFEHGFAAAIPGFLYLLRLTGYLGMFVVLWNVFRQKTGYNKKVVDILIIVSTAISALGWMQYWLWPDLTVLKALGWDDHLFRLVGTFLDPGYSGILITFGAILAFAKFQETKKLTLLGLFLLNVLALGFTYSRASYLAFIAGIATFFIIKRKIRIPIIIIPLFLLGIIFLPRPGGEGVRLERTASIIGRAGNYKETVQIIARNPLFGVGYNNLCWYRQNVIFNSYSLGHACGGSDSSLLYVFATTGVIGAIFFFTLIFEGLKNLIKDYKLYIYILTVALFFHSFFANSLLYPWVLGYLAILFAISVKKN